MVGRRSAARPAVAAALAAAAALLVAVAGGLRADPRAGAGAGGGAPFSASGPGARTAVEPQEFHAQGAPPSRPRLNGTMSSLVSSLLAVPEDDDLVIPPFLWDEAEGQLSKNAVVCCHGRAFGVTMPLAKGAKESKFFYLRPKYLHPDFKDMDLYADLHDYMKYFLFYRLKEIGHWRMAYRRWNGVEWTDGRVFRLGDRRPCVEAVKASSPVAQPKVEPRKKVVAVQQKEEDEEEPSVADEPEIPEFLTDAPEGNLTESNFRCEAGQTFGVAIPTKPGASDIWFAFLRPKEVDRRLPDMHLYVDAYDERRHFLLYRLPEANIKDWRLAYRFWDKIGWLNERVFNVGEHRPCANTAKPMVVAA